jgi:hypothetical protein
MRVDRKWVERNLGFDPIATPPLETTFASPRAAKAATPEDFQREIIDFDSESPDGCSSWLSLRRPAFRATPMFNGPRDWRPRPGARQTASGLRSVPQGHSAQAPRLSMPNCIRRHAKADIVGARGPARPSAGRVTPHDARVRVRVLVSKCLSTRHRSLPRTYQSREATLRYSLASTAGCQAWFPGICLSASRATKPVLRQHAREAVACK